MFWTFSRNVMEGWCRGYTYSERARRRKGSKWRWICLAWVMVVPWILTPMCLGFLGSISDIGMACLFTTQYSVYSIFNIHHSTMTLCTYEYILSKQVTLLTVSNIYKRNEIPIAARSASLLRPITHPRKPLHFPTPSRPKNGTIGLGSGCSYSSARTLDLIGLELYIHLREGPTGDR